MAPPATPKSLVSFEGVEDLVVNERASMLWLAVASSLGGAALAVLLLISLLGTGTLPSWVATVPWWVWLLPAGGATVVWARVMRADKNKALKADQEHKVALEGKAVAAVNKEISRQIQDYNERLRLTAAEHVEAWTHDAIEAATYITLNCAMIKHNQNVGTPKVLSLDWHIICGAGVKCSITITGGKVALHRLVKGRVERWDAPITQLQTDSFDGLNVPGRPPLRVRTSDIPIPLEVVDQFSGSVNLSADVEYSIDSAGVTSTIEVTVPVRLIEIMP